MARKAIVTRTVTGVEVKAVGLNLTTNAPEIRTYILSGTYNKEEKDAEGKVINSVVDESKMLKDVKKLYDSEDFVNVKIQEYHRVDKLYGMYEEDFIANAMTLDPTTRKPIQ